MIKNNLFCLVGSFCLILSATFGCGESTDDPSDTGDNSTTVLDEVPSRTFAEGFIEACNGNNISYQTWTDDGDAYATLIFATGRSEYTDKYHHLLPLIKRNLNIVFFDHLGQGRSDGVRAHLSSVDDEFACDLREIVHSLTDPDLPRFILSHSMGGLATVRALQLEPDLAVAAAFSAPMWGLLYPEGIDTATARLIVEEQVAQGNAEGTISEPGPVASCLDAKITHDCELYDLFKDDPLTIIGPATYGAGLAFLNGIDAMMASLGDVVAPLYVMTAGDEHWVDKSSHAAVCDGINAIHPGRCTHVVHEGEWHELLNEYDRATYLENSLAFFDSHLPQ